MSEIPEHEYPAATPVKSRNTRKYNPGEIIIKHIKSEDGQTLEKKVKVYAQRLVEKMLENFRIFL